MQIEIYDHLYLSDGMKKRRKKVVQQLLHNEFHRGTYLLVLPQGNRNQLEFFDAIQLKNEVYQNYSFFVVGIADSYDEAIFLVENIMQELYAQPEPVSLRAYILGKQL